MYQVLYRKYRPRVFSDVYGQDHVTSTLKNEIKNGRIAHAYLFTGSRGTGKTTCAKILAKAVNCENSIDGEPCNECEVCSGLDNGSIYDVVEIDAASNNGVDNIRDLREEANYTPTRGRYRVYIIDEVHMLSAGAFNALLKTLEEPPAHVIFILATTEVHKLPATILSRCQRFDFKRIQPETMSVRLKQVADAEGISLDDDAAVLIARIADGALRDGLSILDQCAGRSKNITPSLVSEVAGIAGREALYQLSSAIADKDANTAVCVIASLYQNSYDMQRLCVEMINHFRNFLVVKTVKKSRELIVCTDDEYDLIKQSAGNFTLENIIYALDLFQNTLVAIKGGAAARIEVEMAFARLCEPKLEQSMDAVMDRLSSLERAVRNGVKIPVTEKSEAAEPPKSAENAPVKATESKEIPKEENEISAPDTARENPPAPTDVQPEITVQSNSDTRQEAPQNDQTQPFSQWADFMDIIHREDIGLFGILAGAKGYIRGEYFLIDSPNPAFRDFIKTSIHTKAMKKALYELTGKQYKLGLFKRKNPEQQKRDPLEDLINMAAGNTNVDIK